jgi:hypothetical protein
MPAAWSVASRRYAITATYSTCNGLAPWRFSNASTVLYKTAYHASAHNDFSRDTQNTLIWKSKGAIDFKLAISLFREWVTKFYSAHFLAPAGGVYNDCRAGELSLNTLQCRSGLPDFILPLSSFIISISAKSDGAIWVSSMTTGHLSRRLYFRDRDSSLRSRVPKEDYDFAPFTICSRQDYSLRLSLRYTFPVRHRVSISSRRIWCQLGLDAYFLRLYFNNLWSYVLRNFSDC